LLALLLATPAAASDLRAEIMNAAEHAEYSSESATIDNARFHLHHALNCLVGPAGEGFDATQFYPCRGIGNGVVPDAADPALRARFAGAAATIRKALAEDDLPKAQADAADAARTIVATLKQVK
jgi:hypothetical protein